MIIKREEERRGKLKLLPIYNFCTVAEFSREREHIIVMDSLKFRLNANDPDMFTEREIKTPLSFR